MALFFYFTDGQSTPLVKKVTTSTPLVLINGADASRGGQYNLVWMTIYENAGSTPNLTVDIYDVAGAISYPLADEATTASVWAAKAVTANQVLRFGSQPIPYGYQLRITSSDVAGKFTILGSYVGRTRSAIGAVP